MMSGFCSQGQNGRFVTSVFLVSLVSLLNETLNGAMSKSLR